MHWCPEHLFQSVRNTHWKKNAHREMMLFIGKPMGRSIMYIHTHMCIRIHMHTISHAHDTAPHANDSLLRLTTYVKIYIHILIHMYIHVYTYLYIYTCIYVHTYMFLHTHTCTYIRTHIQHVHIHARKHAWNNVSASTA